MMLVVLLLSLFQQPAEGPLYDAIVRRIESAHEREMGSLRDNFNQVRQAIADAREDARTSRGVLVSRIADLRGQVADLIRKRNESAKRWTPLLDLADRLVALGWKLILAVVLFFVLIEIVRAGVIFTINRAFRSFTQRPNL